jgi:hypothetical protein
MTVRLMAPFGMKCTACGEYIYKGRKFNARKETTDEKYLGIAIIRLYIRCTRCSAEITFKTDPKNNDYTCERGAKRNFEMWRPTGEGTQESDMERLDRLEREEAERDAMGELETKMVDAKREMQIEDALDEIRLRNARNERTAQEGDGNVPVGGGPVHDEAELRRRQEQEDDAAAARAFRLESGERVRRMAEDEGEEAAEAKPMPPPPAFKRVAKRKPDFGAALGIKRRPALA